MPNLTLDPQDGTEPITLAWQSGYAILPGPIGLGMPPRELVGDQLANEDGMRVSSVTVGPRDITVPLDVWATDRPTFLQRRRRLQHICAKRSTLKLTYAEDDGTQRWITGYYVGGLEGDGGTDRETERSELFAVKFRCADPWWYGPEQTLDIGLGAGTNFFPIFPLVLSPSTVQGEFTIDLSDSDAPTYPTWTITGPGSSLVLTNQTTGRVIAVNASLSAGQTMVIDTRRGDQSVRRGDGTNLMGLVTSDPALWPLVEDVNVVTAALTGATSASRIAGAFQPRYAGV